MKISIKAARVNAGLTITAAAMKLGLAVSTLSSYENGKTRTPFDVAAKMSDLYGMPLENLMATKEGIG